MGPLAALAAAVAFGIEDLLGALAARRTSALTVALGLQVAGALVLVPFVVLGDGVASVRALGLGGLAGVTGTLGFVGYLRAMRVGPIGVVSPLAALTGAGTPVLWGVIVNGDTLATAQVVGVLLGLAAVGLVARPPGQVARGRDLRVPAMALAAGVSFGAFFIGLDAAPDGSGWWPLVGARVASALATVVLLRLVSRPAPPRDAVPLILVAGTSGMIANVAFLHATRLAPLSVASLLASLYPVVALVLARRVLHERLAVAQGAGVVLALAASGLLVVG